eukprot:m.120875 g.120875  ORF g.120875 m.120875 type:complete len:1049 (-) comp12917_c0_seq4:201-3347(-)
MEENHFEGMEEGEEEFQQENSVEVTAGEMSVSVLNRQLSSGNGLRVGGTEAGMTDPTLFKKLQDPQYQSDYGVSLMHIAVISRSPSEFQQALLQYPDYVNVIDNVERTPIYFAILLGRTKIFKLLVDAGAMLNVADLDGCTPAHWAVYNGNSDILQVIIAKAVDLNAVDNQGRSVLHWATAHKAPKCTEILAKLPRVDVNAIDEEQMTPLHWACFHNNAKHMKALLNAKSNVSARDVEGKTPLHWCSGNKDASCVKILLGQDGVNVNERDNEGRTLLHLCVGDQNKEILSVLLKNKKCDSGVVDNTGRSALHWAVALNYSAMVTQLAKSEAAYVRDSDGATPYHYAAQSTNDDTLKALLKGDNKGAHVDIVDEEDRTALFWAMAHDHEAIASLLLDAGANPNKKDKTGRTILHLMAASHPHQVKVLVKRSVDVNIVDDEHGETAILIACDSEQPEIVQTLLDGGANLSVADRTERTALHVSSISGSLECLEILTNSKKGKELLNKQDERGETPIHYASYYGHDDCVSHLLSVDADPNLLDHEGISAMHWAASQGFANIVHLLLQYNAHPNFLDRSENTLTPMDYAAAGGHTDIVAMLADAGGAHSVDLKEYAAVKLQTAWRMYSAKKQLKHMKEERAVVTIQAHVRGFIQRKQFASLKATKRKEEEDKLKRISEEEELLNDEMRKEAEEKRRKQEDEQKKRKEEQLRKEKEEAAKKQREQEQRAEQKKRKEEARKRSEEEERRRRERKIKEERDKKRREEERLQQEEANLYTYDRRVTTPKQATEILSNRQRRVRLVRGEQSRVNNVRKKIDAAMKIQKWWRRNLRLQKEFDGPKPPVERVQQRTPVVYKEVRTNSLTTKGAPKDNVVKSSVKQRDVFTRKELIAALTIQLWWRRYLAKKHRLSHPRRKKTGRGPHAANTMQSQRLNFVYNSNDGASAKRKSKSTRSTSKTRQRNGKRGTVPVKQFKAKPARPVRTTLLPDVPPAVTMSWISATENYYQPPAPRGSRHGGRTQRTHRSSLPHISQPRQRTHEGSKQQARDTSVAFPSI